MQYAGQGGNTISIIDAATRVKTGVIDLGEYRRPHGMAVHPVTGQLVVTIENPNGLLPVDPQQRKVIRKFDAQGESPHMVLFGPGGRPQGGVLAPGGKTIYLTNAESNKIVIVETATDRVIGEISTSTYPNRVTITPDGKTLVYSLGNAGEAVGFVDTATRREAATLPLHGQPPSLTGKYAYSGIRSQGKIHVIDVAQRKIIRTIEAPRDAGPDPALPIE